MFLRASVATVAAAACMLLAGLAPLHAQGFQTAAPHAILIDYDSESVLFEKSADTSMPPASMSKLMTMAVVFEELKQGRLKLEDEFSVSQNAWKVGGATSGGSTMYAVLNSSIKVGDLIQGIIIQSANDACIVIAEGISGSEASFAGLMNRRAAEIGLTNSNFKNSTGLPDPEHRMTARDLAKLARHIMDAYPEYYKYYSQTDFTWNKIRQPNRNPLLTMNIGADGLKTGYTAESGYGLVASAVRDGQRLILVVNGLRTAKERGDESRKLMDWGFRAFDRVVLYPAGEKVAEAKVFGGEVGRVDLAARGNIAVLLPKGGSAKDYRARITYDGPIPAPIEQGQALAKLRVTNGDKLVLERQLFAAAPVGRGSMQSRAFDAATELVLGWW